MYLSFFLFRRCYALRRIRDGFRNNKQLSDETQILNEIAYAKNNLEIVKRQVHK